MTDLEIYLQEIVEPTVKDFTPHPADMRFLPASLCPTA